MLGKLALPEIRELIEAHDDDTLREVVNRWHSADLAELVDALSHQRAGACLAADQAEAGRRDLRLPRSRHSAGAS